MKIHLLAILNFLCLALSTSHAALPAEIYWNGMLPNTPMPNVIKDLLKLGKGDVQSVNLRKGTVDVSNLGILGSLGHKGMSLYMGSQSLIRINKYNGRPPPKDQLQRDPNAEMIFFFKEDMIVGKKMNLHFYKPETELTFLPRQIAKSIPFSSNKLSDVLNRFSIRPMSDEAKMMKDTIKLCEAPGIAGEPETCATSLESMVDFVVSHFGKNVRAITTEIEKETKKQEYTIISEATKVVSGKSVACHKFPYIYAVFYCHSPLTTEAYSVPLVGEDGHTVDAIVVCHKDTSAWDPQHLAFQLLKVKPGTVPICHFVRHDHIVWAPY